MIQTAPTRTRSNEAASRIEAFALYGAFALIGAVAFGTLSLHSFW